MSNIENNLVRVIKDFCEQADHSFYPDYSGRGMYGKKCVGISFEGSLFDLGLELAAFIMASYQDDLFEAEELVNDLKDLQSSTDQLGMGYIVYWKHLKAE